MSSLSKLHASYERADRWLRDHIVAYWIAMAAVSGGTYAAVDFYANDSVPRALLGGVGFGLTYFVLQFFFRRRS